MIKTFLLLAMLTSLAASAQKLLAPKKNNSINHPGISYRLVKNISPSTAMLLIRWKSNAGMPGSTFATGTLLADSSLIKTYGIITQNQVQYVNVFIGVADNFKVADLAPYGFLPGTISPAMVTGMVPLQNIEALANDVNVKYLSAEQKAAPALDSAKIASRVNLVHQGYQLPHAYFGDGVVVGIVDIGLNYDHPNFYDTTGLTNFRIKRVWEQLATSGTLPVGFSYGRELATATDIINAQRDITLYSHGTQVLGIAAGAGGGLGAAYRGVAPNSDIVMVSTDGTPSKLLDGISYIMAYATSVGKPCVVNLSWGSHLGPHDGNSAFDKLCDVLVGPGKIIVGADGNQGADSIYLAKTYAGNDTSLFSFIRFPFSSNGTNGQANIDLWGNENEDFKIAVNLYNTTTNQYEDNTAYFSASNSAAILDTLYDSDGTPQRTFLSISSGIDALNNKPHILLNINSTQQSNSNQYVQIELVAKNSQTKAWAADGNAIFSSRGYGGKVSGGATSSTMGELGGTGKSIISVGAFTAKTDYKALNGNPFSIAGQNTIGTIASFSSKGPTADGRVKPDITAPGNFLISSVNRYHSAYTSSSNSVAAVASNAGGNWYYAYSAGTSMATPVVTGTVALWLQADPTLTPAQVKQYLKDSAITDVFTGTILPTGSNTWGWGKVDAWRGLQKVRKSVVYTFNGNGNWSEPTNWTNSIAPPANLIAGTIVIDHQLGGKCILNVPQIIATGSSLIIKINKNLVVPASLQIK